MHLILNLNLTNDAFDIVVVPGKDRVDGRVEDLSLPLAVLRRRLLRLHRVVGGRGEAHGGSVAGETSWLLSLS